MNNPYTVEESSIFPYMMAADVFRVTELYDPETMPERVDAVLHDIADTFDVIGDAMSQTVFQRDFHYPEQANAVWAIIARYAEALNEQAEIMIGSISDDLERGLQRRKDIGAEDEGQREREYLQEAV